jgi:energy-coupling factor transporter ATP-binding protein EcfA2
MSEQEFLNNLDKGVVFANETKQFVKQYRDEIVFLESRLEMKEKQIKELVNQYKHLVDLVKKALQQPNSLTEAVNNMSELSDIINERK